MTDHHLISGDTPQALEADEDFSFQDNTIILINEVSRIHGHLIQHYARCHGLTPSLIHLLLTLIQRGPLRMIELSCRLGRSPSNLTPLTRQLEERGLITRSRDMRDGRSIQLEATDAGRALMVELYNAMSRDADAEGIGINPRYRRQIVESLEILSVFLSGLYAAIGRRDDPCSAGKDEDA